MAFVCTEMLEFCSQGFWTVLPLSVALRLSQHLRLPPLGVVPQRNRRSRLIVDYSFSGVNEETVKLAPSEAMQSGRALHRLLQRIAHAEPSYGPVYLGKIDIADDFFRVSLQPHDIPRLGVILPTTTGEPLVALPLTLPMGWVESPPYLTAVTETACNLVNDALHDLPTTLPYHPMESLALTPPPDTTTPAEWPPRSLASQGSAKPRPPPLAYADVYVDGFAMAAQTKRHRQRVLRAALHSIDSVLRPLVVSDDRASLKEPVSVKKLRQGDAACWATTKTILGWDVDTAAGTLNLPPRRLARLYELLDALATTRKRVSEHKRHQLLGELHSLAPAALPGARAMFSTLQDALICRSHTRVRLTRKFTKASPTFAQLQTHCATDRRGSANSYPLDHRQHTAHATPHNAAWVVYGLCTACPPWFGGRSFPPSSNANSSRATIARVPCPSPTSNSRARLPTSRSWYNCCRSPSALFGSLATTRRVWRGRPKDPPLPSWLARTSYTSTPCTNAVTATFRCTIISRVPPTLWRMLPAVTAGICPMKPSSPTLILFFRRPTHGLC